MFAIRSVCRGRKIPGYKTLDPLTLPFLDRPSVRQKVHDRARLAWDEVRSVVAAAKAGAKLPGALRPGWWREP